MKILVSEGGHWSVIHVSVTMFGFSSLHSESTAILQIVPFSSHLDPTRPMDVVPILYPET